MEIVVVLHAQVAVRVPECGVREVVVAVEDTRSHTCAGEGLRQVVARVDAGGVDLLRGHVHHGTGHPLGLDALDGVVVRQLGDVIERDVHDVDTAHIVDEAAAVGNKKRCRVAWTGKRYQSVDSRCLYHTGLGLSFFGKTSLHRHQMR